MSHWCIVVFKAMRWDGARDRRENRSTPEARALIIEVGKRKRSQQRSKKKHEYSCPKNQMNEENVSTKKEGPIKS